MLESVLARYAEAAIDLVFPRICCGCEERITEPARIVCSNCEDELEDLQLPICDTCGCPNAAVRSGGRCDDCPGKQIAFEAARGTTPFNGLAKIVVEKLKYHARTEYAPMMARRMLNTWLAQFEGVEFDAIVPVPLHATRLRERGFNQSQELARLLSRYSGVPMRPKIVKRARPTPSQTRLTRKERARNIEGAFVAGPGDLGVNDARLLLIDDVYTTGATLNECAGVLKAAGASEVYCLAFARATLD